jgi:prepilin-type N-terminal cleavage/methylation domain-containing protein
MGRPIRTASRTGFTLIELVVATLLGSIVMISLSYILIPLIQSQVYAGRAQTAQLNLAAVDQLVERELRQASLLSKPAVVGAPSGVLEGCANAAGSPPAPLVLGSTMSWFAFCTSGGIVYYHTGSGCPALYKCGTSPTAAFMWGTAPESSLTFARPSAGSTLVTADMKASSGNSVAEVTSAVAFSAPAGGAQ